MQQFTTQLEVKNKSEAIDSDNALEYTMYITASQDGVSGELRINVTDEETNQFFSTGDMYDVVITPHVIPE